MKQCMRQIINLDGTEVQIFEKVKRLFSGIRKVLSEEPLNLGNGVEVVNRLRKLSYEELNQIQHEVRPTEA